MPKGTQAEESNIGTANAGLKAMNIEVHCYSGHTYAERPDWFRWEGTDHKVQEVVREWQEPGERHFQVRTKDNRLFELCYDNQADKWTVRELT